MKYIVSYGGGINSTAMIVGLWQRGIKVDHILFADTGGERVATYRYIKYFNRWLFLHGMPCIEIVRYRTKEGQQITLEEDIIANNTLPGIAFGFKSCSEKFKIRPQNKWIKERYDKEDIIHFIGFDSGEERRIKPNPLKRHFNQYPLITWKWNREECKNRLHAAGLCIPPKSSCFFCPNMRKEEILKLSQREKQRVRFIEANASRKVELKGLGRQFSWTDLLDSSDKDQFDDLEMYQTPCECIT